MEAERELSSTTANYSETLISSETEESNHLSTRHQQSCQEEVDDDNSGGGVETKTASFEQKDIVKALEVVERDSIAIAQSFTSLFASLRLALSQVTSSSVDHMDCLNDAAGRLQECDVKFVKWYSLSSGSGIASVAENIAQLWMQQQKGNRYINSCLRLNEEMKGVDSLATQLKMVRRNVDALDLLVNRHLRLP